MTTERIKLSEIRRYYVSDGRPLPATLEALLRDDPRAGARAILDAIERRRRANRSEGQRLRYMLRFERELWDTGVKHIAGVDECGMSPLAGPVVAGAVILPVDFRWPGIDDSKKLDERTRTELVEIIKRHALAWSVGFVQVEEIDSINIYRAGLLAMRRAVEGLGLQPETLLIDARKLPELQLPQRAIVHGDALSLSIAAASIVAKTTRDAYMRELDPQYPQYGFARHKGYGVPEHYAALRTWGVLPIHRRSFGPVRQALGLDGQQLDIF